MKSCSQKFIVVYFSALDAQTACSKYKNGQSIYAFVELN